MTNDLVAMHSRQPSAAQHIAGVQMGHETLLGAVVSAVHVENVIAPVDARSVMTLPALDGLRGLSAILILFHHILVSIPFMYPGQTVPSVVEGGALGVMFFFVLSGFVLYLPVARNAGNFGSSVAYFRRRAMRILPAYLLALGALLLLIWPLWLHDVPNPLSTVGGWMMVGVHLLLLQHIVLGPGPVLGFTTGDGFGMNGSLWTLTIEACFYITLPLVATSFFRRPVLAATIAVITSFAWRRFAVLAPQSGLATQFPAYLGHFAIGIVGAIVLLRLWTGRGSRRAQRVSGSLVALAVAMLIPLMSLHGARGYQSIYDIYLSDLLPAAVFGVLAVTACLAGPRVQWVFTNHVSRWLGRISFGVYLWHMPLMQVAYRAFDLQQLEPTVGRQILLAFVVPISLLIGWLSFRFVEQPAIRWVRGLEGRADSGLPLTAYPSRGTPLPERSGGAWVSDVQRPMNSRPRTPS